jgi:hypothetical protein
MAMPEVPGAVIISEEYISTDGLGDNTVSEPSKKVAKNGAQRIKSAGEDRAASRQICASIYFRHSHLRHDEVWYCGITRIPKKTLLS